MASPRRSAATDEQRQEKLNALHERLHREVQALVSGDDWQRWLQVASRFHTYSFRNTLLILAQRPDATQVAGYEAWRTLGRQVDKGECGIQILAPVLRRSATKGENERSGEVDRERRLVGFRLAYVWDLSQTSGEPLPTQPKPVLLSGQAPAGLWDALVAVATDRDFTVDRGDCRGANGYTDFAARAVRVRDDVDDAQACKTLAHELGHVTMHDPAAFAGTTAGCRGVVEVEAESLAYLVAASHGLDASGYTFAYVASWAGTVNGSEPEAVVHATGQHVMNAAHTVLSQTQTATPPEHAELATRLHAGQERAGDARRHADAAAAAAAAHLADPVEDLLAIHEAATDFFAAQLPGSWVPDYLVRRGLDAAIQPAAPWSVGYAPAKWTGLTDHLRRAGYDDATLEASGLALRSSRGNLIDRFRDRAMLPIRHPEGAVIAFIGRAHPEGGDAVPRYLNSPETTLYHKSDVLYGLAEGRAGLVAGARPVLVEGPLDAIAVTEGTGGRCVGLAPCGTALTTNQVEALGDTAPMARTGLVVAFDGDPSGRAATLRAYDILRGPATHALTANVADGQDPAGILAREGPAALTETLVDPQRLRPVAEVVIDDRIGWWADRLRFVEGQLGALSSVVPIIAALPPDTIGRHVVRVAERLSLDLATVTAAVTDALSDAPPVAASALVDRGYPQVYGEASRIQARTSYAAVTAQRAPRLAQPAGPPARTLHR